MSVRCASHRWLGKALGIALIAGALLPVASTPGWADSFRGGHFVGHPFFHGPFVHGRFFHGPFFHGPVFVHGPRVFVGVGPVAGPVYYPYPYPYPYPAYPYAYPYPYYAPPPPAVVYP